MVTVDGTELYQQAITRIAALEKLNATLAAQVDRMCPVVEAARSLNDTLTPDGTKMQQRLERLVFIRDAVDAYNAAMAQLAKEEVKGDSNRA